MNSWKSDKIDFVKVIYGDKIREYDQHYDDRRLYVNTYRMIMDALICLPDEPPIFLKVAINDHLDKELEKLSRIRKFFDSIDKSELYEEV